MARLEQLSGNHATCSITEFAVWMKVSRQTVYNWKDSNYLVKPAKAPLRDRREN